MSSDGGRWPKKLRSRDVLEGFSERTDAESDSGEPGRSACTPNPDRMLIALARLVRLLLSLGLSIPSEGASFDGGEGLVGLAGGERRIVIGGWSAKLEAEDFLRRARVTGTIRRVKPCSLTGCVGSAWHMLSNSASVSGRAVKN